MCYKCIVCVCVRVYPPATSKEHRERIIWESVLLMTQNIMFTPDDLEFYSGIWEMKARREMYTILSFLNNAYNIQLNRIIIFFLRFFLFLIITTEIYKQFYKMWRLTFRYKYNKISSPNLIVHRTHTYTKYTQRTYE